MPRAELKLQADVAPLNIFKSVEKRPPFLTVSAFLYKMPISVALSFSLSIDFMCPKYARYRKGSVSFYSALLAWP